MGRVLLVRDRYLERDVALKLILEGPPSEAAAERLRREFALLSEIRHPGIARAIDFGYAGGHPYFTTEYVPGESLAAPPEGIDLLDVARQIAAAAAFLHREGVLHLDIKPANLIASPSRGAPRIVLIDFGIFREALAAAPGALRGSLHFMAPEFFGGSLGPWSDVYAIGATLHGLATGRHPRPFPRDPAAGLAAWQPAPDPAPEMAAMSTDLANVVFKCLALDPAARFADGGELLEALRRLGDARRAADRAPAEPARIQTVGRAGELAAIDRFIGALLDEEGGRRSEPPCLLVTGARGMGQTHLLRELKVRAQVRGARVILETGYPGQSTSPGSVLGGLRACMAAGEAAAARRWEAFLTRLSGPRGSSRNEVLEEERRARRSAELARAIEAIDEPLIVAVDGLQFRDEVSVELILDLARALAKGGGEGRPRPPVALAAGYREEGPSARILRDLTGLLLGEGRADVISLGPLSVADSLRLWGLRSGRPPGEADGLRIFQATGGSPSQVLARASSAAGEPPGPGAAGAARPDAVEPGTEEARVLLVLQLLRRPANAGEIARMTGIPPRRVKRLLPALEERLLASREPDAEEEAWAPGPAAGAPSAIASPAVLRRTHGRIARVLAAEAAGREGPRLVELARHLRQAGNRSAVARHGLAAARYLKASFQSLAALDLYRAVLDSLPEKRGALRAQVTFEMADVMARVGALEEGVRLLGGVLRRRAVSPGRERARLLLQLATLHSRAGEFRRARRLFAQGFGELDPGGASLERHEQLIFLNEQAAMTAFAGAHDEAVRLCDEGLRLARRSRRIEVREVALNLLATRANVSLRTFHHDAAIEDFRSALEIAESIGSSSNRAVVLNNLGIVYANSDRYHEAIEAFTAAREIGEPLDEGPSLVGILGNLAMLHAKAGDFAAAERALAGCAAVHPGAMGRRQELFHEHASGLSLLHRGRFAEARVHLERAVRLGEETGDRMLAAFDRAYRAEALIFEGAYAEASRALEEVSADSTPGRVRAMARARLAFLGALTASPDRVAAALAEHERLGREEARRVPFLDAWDDVFLGWALAIAGAEAAAPGGDAARERLERARAYFEAHGLRPAASLAGWILAELSFLDGDREEALEALDRAGSPVGDLAAALFPLLRARLLLEDPGADAPARVADLLAGAGGALAGNVLPEWSLRLAALRDAAGAGTDGRTGPPERERRKLAEGLDPAAARRHRESRHWRLWCAPRRPRRRGPAGAKGGAPPAAARGARRKAAGDTTRAGTARLDGSRDDPRRMLVARSPAMRRVVELLDRVRRSDLPVLIAGETGAGKEVIARIIHLESRRAARPFTVVECAAIPAGLLEVELFGARAGSYTDLAGDRGGILAAAEGGSVLIDEVAGLPLDVQGKLLGVLSRGAVRSVGADLEHPIDVRFLFTTSRNLEEEVERGRLRRDLLHRIRVLSVEVPPLRERAEDIPDLVERLLAKDCAGAGPPAVEAGVLQRLREMPWPGNVRELRNLLARLRVECSDRDRITLEALERCREGEAARALVPTDILAHEPLAAIKDRVEREFVVHHFRRLGGDARELSRFLGIGRQHLYKRCRQLGIRLWEERRRLR
jgi:DNA-binding NtrC family response regulator/tetratricopeptide (TPR) repeat protein